jgi:hypothetical protein
MLKWLWVVLKSKYIVVDIRVGMLISGNFVKNHAGLSKNVKCKY